jgi:hypothetical protein
MTTTTNERPHHLDGLDIGDIVQHRSGELWLVTDVTYGSIAVVRTVQIHHPGEWKLISKAHHTEAPR